MSSGWQQFYYEARACEWRERAKCNRIYMRLQFAYATVFLVSSAAFYMMFPRLWFLWAPTFGAGLGAATGALGWRMSIRACESVAADYRRKASSR